MSAVPNLVNAQAQSLTSVNKDKSSTKSDLKDSVKDAKTDFAQLIFAVLKNGTNEKIGSNFAPIIGLPKAMPVMDVGATISNRRAVKETRRCFVAYEEVENPDSENGVKRALCVYVMKTKRSGLDKQEHYFRIDLNGKLEKVVLSKSKYDEAGKIVRGSGVKTDLDINSPEVKKAFDAEMNFWLKDWLKKEQKNAAKKTADAATKKPSTTAL